MTLFTRSLSMPSVNARLQDCLWAPLCGMLLFLGFFYENARAETPVTLALEKKAEFWASHGRDDLETQTYRQLLFIDPTNRPALIALASDALREGNRPLARRYIATLRKLDPQDPSLPSFARESQLGPLWSREIERARRASDRHLYFRALSHYQKAFGPYPPPPRYAVEYFNDMVHSKEGRREAERQLRGLVRTYPESLHYRLALGEILSYKDNTRPEAVEILKPMAESPSPVSDTATAAWRQLLLWEGTLPRNIPQMKAYLLLHPKDRLLSDQLGLAEKRALSAGPESREAYRSLDRGQFGKAIQLFRGLLEKDPRNPGYWIGLSYAYLGRKDFEKSRSALANARRLPLTRLQAGEERDLSAQISFWTFMGRGKKEEADGDFEAAQTDYANADRIRPDQPIVKVAQAALAARMGHMNRAESLYKKALEVSPDDSPAWMGLLSLYGREGQDRKALAKLTTLNSSLRMTLEENPDFLVTEGGILAHTDHPAQARRAFQRALQSPVRVPPDHEILWGWTMLDAGSRRPLSLLLSRLDKVRNLSQTDQGNLRKLHHLRAFREEQGLLARKDYEQALSRMKDHASHHPSDPFYQEQEASILEAQGKNREAYRLILTLGPGSTLSSYEAASGVAIAAGHPLQAEVWIDDAGARWPGSVRVALLKVHLLEARKEPKKARKILEKALIRHPRDPRLLLAKADNDRILGHLNQARSEIEQAIAALRTPSPSQQPPLDIALLSMQARTALASVEKDRQRRTRGHLELMAGETAFTQYTQYYYAQVGDLIPLTGFGHFQSDNGGEPFPLLHLFLMGNAFTFEYHPTPTDSSFLSQSYEGLTPAVGIRFPTSFGYWEGDAGVAVAQHFQTLTPPGTVTGLFLQTDLLWNFLGGGLDLFANFTGYIDYVYFQARYLTPVWQGDSRRTRLDLGPEFITQGNSTYDAFQGGVALRLWLAPLDSSILFDGGVLGSSAFPGVGGYEGVSWYFLY